MYHLLNEYISWSSVRNKLPTQHSLIFINSAISSDDLLLSEEELNKVWILQKLLSSMNTIEGMEFLIDKMRKTKTNAEFFESINKRITEV